MAMLQEKERKENFWSLRKKEEDEEKKEKKRNVGKENEWSRILFIQRRVQKFKIPILPLY